MAIDLDSDLESRMYSADALEILRRLWEQKHEHLHMTCERLSLMDRNTLAYSAESRAMVEWDRQRLKGEVRALAVALDVLTRY